MGDNIKMYIKETGCESVDADVYMCSHVGQWQGPLAMLI
jgi:hypothetical protein